MTGASDVSEGGCRCGQVRFRVNGAPLLTAACHCKGCQRMSGSAFSLSSTFPAGAFTIVDGEPVIGGMHGTNRHFFCPHCLSWVFNRPEDLSDLVFVRTTMLDFPYDTRPFIEFFRSEGLPWASTGAIHSYDTAPELGEFPSLIAEFAANRR